MTRECQWCGEPGAVERELEKKKTGTLTVMVCPVHSAMITRNYDEQAARTGRRRPQGHVVRSY